MNSGIPYFPLDVHLDDKFELIEAEFGLKGFAIVVKLLQKIYGGQGYYCEWTKDVKLLFARAINTNDNLVSQIVEASIKRGIFDEKLFEKYGILTSKGIQARYFEAVSRRKKVDAIKQYLLVEVAQNYKNVNILLINDNILSENVNILEQRREEESKEEYSKVEESIATASDPAIAVFHKYEQMIGLATPAVREDIDSFIEKGIETALIIRLIEYACEQNKRTWSYIRAAIRGNMDAGIKTLDAYNRAQADRAENARKVERTSKNSKKSKFNNYVDTNKPDYSNFANEILADMLREEGVRSDEQNKTKRADKPFG